MEEGLNSPAETDDRLQQRQQRQLKRSSLPARPHAAARHTKRLTLNFPINIPPAGSVPTSADPSVSSPGSMTPLTQTSTTRQSPAIGTPLPLETPEDDGSSILTAIASQERKVLEVREELQRAETELASLKKQWVLSEKSKKRTEINHHAEPLVSLRSPIQPTGGWDSGQQQQQQQQQQQPQTGPSDRSKELDRRRSVRSAVAGGSSVSANGRRVFQGSHTRTLSLLSASTDSGFSKPSPKMDYDQMARPPRSATLPSSIERNPDNVSGSSSMMEPTENMVSQWRKTMPPPSREALMQTGKQMASDLREGLWTFLDDIRQATVGEEGINATEVRGSTPRSSGSRSSRDRLSVQGGLPSRSPSSSSRSRGAGAGTEAETRIYGKDTTKSTDIDSSFWNEFGIDTPGQKSPNARGAVSNPPNGATDHDSSNRLVVDDEDWDAWDSTPQPKNMHTPSSSRSTLESKHDQSPRSQASSSPRTSTRYATTTTQMKRVSYAPTIIP